MRIPTLLFVSLLSLVTTRMTPAASSETIVDQARAAFDLVGGEITTLPLPEFLAETITIPLSLDGVESVIELRRRSLRAPNFRLLVDRGAGLIEETPPPSRTYRGDLYQIDAPFDGVSRVAASLTEEGLYAMIRRPDGVVYGVEPLRSRFPQFDRALHIVYRADQAAPIDATCGSNDVGAVLPPPADDAPLLLGAGNALTRIAFDSDVEFYNQNGSSVTNTVNDIENVQNGVESIYENDVGITYAITVIVVRTTEPDPYDVTDPGSLLNQFRSEWALNMQDVERDIAHLMTGKNLDGSTIGIASLGVICNLSGSGLSQSRYTTNLTNRIALTSHELGHNWGSPHCSGSGCFIMCPSLGGCGPVTLFGSFAQSAITNYKNNAACLGVDGAPVAVPFVESFAGPTLEPSYWTASASNVAILSTAANEPSPPYSLRLQSSGGGANLGEVTSVPVALGEQGGATFAYSTEHIGVESGKSLVVEYFAMSLTWVELTRHISNGADQSTFDEHFFILPSDALHDGFRVRFRAEGTATSDDWFIDDIVVGPPPPAPPSITSILPNQVEALFGDSISVVGGGFSTSGLSVTVNGVPQIPFFEYFVGSDSTMELKPSSAMALGNASLVISNSLGTTAAATLDFVATDPPRLLGPFFVVNGQTLDLSWGGAPGDLAFLLVALSGDTFPFQGGTLLNFNFLIPVAPLNSAGLGGISSPIQGAPAGVTIYSQIITIPPPGTDSSKAKLTNIVGFAILG